MNRKKEKKRNVAFSGMTLYLDLIEHRKDIIIHLARIQSVAANALRGCAGLMFDVVTN